MRTIPSLLESRPQGAMHYLASVFVTNFSNSITFIVAGKTLYDSSGSVTLFGGIIILEHVKSLLLSQVSGSFVDRIGAKKIAVWTDVLMFVVTLIMAIGSSIGNRAWAISFGLIAINFLKPFYRTSTFALVRSLVPDDDLFRFNTRSASVFQIGYIAGLGAGAVLITQIAAPQLMAMVSLSYLISAFFLSRTRGRFTKPNLAEPVVNAVHEPHIKRWLRPLNTLVSDLRAQVQLLKSIPALIWLMCFFALQMAVIDSYNVNIFKIAKVNFPNNPEYLSIFEGCFFVASLLATGLIDKFKKSGFPYRALASFFVVEGIAFAGLPAAKNVFQACACIALLGMCVPAVLGTTVTLLQRNTPTAFLGRIGGVRGVIVSLISIPFISGTSLLSDRFSLHISALWVVSLLLLGCICVILTLKKVETATIEAEVPSY